MILWVGLGRAHLYGHGKHTMLFDRETILPTNRMVYRVSPTVHERDERIQTVGVVVTIRNFEKRSRAEY
jgi:hypothetical protein